MNKHLEFLWGRIVSCGGFVTRLADPGRLVGIWT